MAIKTKTVKKSAAAKAPKPSLKVSALKSARIKKTSKPVFEKVDWRAFGPGHVIGVDEVGRGCLAGPVFAAAVILLSEDGVHEYTDSKLLSFEKREKISPQIHAAHRVAIASASVEEIDEINILRASHLAMRRAIEALGVKSGHVLVDGNMKIPLLKGFKQTTFVKGDLRCAPISAASIVAKVARDRLMIEMDNVHPGYGFASHKGYSCDRHRGAIQAMGPTILHRRTFAGVKEYLQGPEGRTVVFTVR